MSEKTTRPDAGTKKIHHKENFELCYLRHQYVRKAKTNPTKDEMSPFLPISSHMAKNTFYTYKNLFHIVGFDVEDLISIANVHLVSFLGLFSLDKLPEKYEDFVNLYRNKNQPDPTEDQLLNKNKANCTLFMKQRMEDVVRVCRQKARNIKGLVTEEYYFFCGQKKPPKFIRDLLDGHQAYGYKKLDQAVYKSIRKKVITSDSPVFRFNDMYYVAVPVPQKTLTIKDFSGAGLDPHDSLHNMTPEQALSSVQKNTAFEKKTKEFNSKTDERKAIIIRKFINKNYRNILYKEEVNLARKMLRSLI